MNEPLKIPRNLITVKLTDGPLAGTYARVLGFGDDCYQKVGREQVWCRYLKNLYARGEYIWSGEAVTEYELKRKVETDTKNTYGATQGA